jgi:hypothetical protein
MNKPGRPKGEKTIEKERIAKLIEDIKKQPGYRYDGCEIDFDHADKVEKQILKQFRVSSAITKTQAFAMSSLGIETTPEEDQKTLEEYKNALGTIHQGQIKGAASTKQKAFIRAHSLWSKNEDLIQKIKQGRSLDEVAKKIIKEWDKRGVGSKVPHKNTIKNLYKIYVN